MDNKDFLFKDMPVKKAVISLAVPTVLSQIITLVYNMADTFFIGQINNPGQVAAVSVSMPVFIIITALSNLFGIGGRGKVSRSLGKGDSETAKKTVTFSIYTVSVVSVVYGIVIYLVAPRLLPVLGARPDIYDYCLKYIFWTVTIGALPTVLNTTLAHMVRTEGYAKQAGFGIAMGGVANIILDPVFIFGLKMEIAGAAIATMLSNTLATVYFVLFIRKLKNNTVIVIHPKYYTTKENIVSEVLVGGMPSFIMMLMSCVSNSVLNRLITAASTEAMAGMGIAKKIDMVAFTVAQGMTQGIVPLVAYNYASGNRKRMTDAIKVTAVYTLIFAFTAMATLWLFAGPVTKCFIKDSTTVEYGRMFLKILCLNCPSTTINYMIIAVFQATKQKTQPMILSFLRKGTVDVPLMIILNSVIGIQGIAWATPISDWITLAIALCMFIPFLKKMNSPQKTLIYKTDR